MHEQERADEGEAQEDPAEPAEEGRPAAVARRLVVLRRAELLGLEAQDDQEERDGEGDEDADRIDPLLRVRSPRPS
jgi:hypothetical protein